MKLRVLTKLAAGWKKARGRSDGLQAKLDSGEYIVVHKADWDALRQTVTDLRRENEELRRTHRAEIANLMARIDHLEERLNASSRNSSKPPSSDGPSTPKASKRPKTQAGDARRRRGGQKGHVGKGRKLLPSSEVSRVVECRPDGTCDCGGKVVVEEEAAERRQVFDVPKIKPDVTEFRIHGGQCLGCGKKHRGALPAGTPTGMLGSRAMAVVAVLSGQYRVSRRQITQIFHDMFGFEISLGSVSNTEARVSQALASPVDEARAFVQTHAIVHMDETSFRVAGKKAWLWVAATTLVSVFAIRFSRGSGVAKEMLGEAFSGWLVTDRWSGYNWVAVDQRQFCWAHLLRDCTKISERDGEAGAIGTALLKQSQTMFSLWHRVVAGSLSRAEFGKSMEPIRAAFESLLEKGAALPKGANCAGHAKTAGTCKNLLKFREALWTFVDNEGIEPTNNFGERTIRPSVIWRKTSFGTQSERGSEFAERMLSVSGSCRQQRRNVLDYVATVVDAHLCGNIAPSLLPAGEMEPVAMAA